jgi:acyl-CoA dehydrogenase
MSELRQQVTDMAEGLFADLAGADFAAVWPRIEEAGFTTLRVSEAGGGFGGDWGDAYAVMRLVGRHALAAPVGDAVIAHGLLAAAGIAPPAGYIGLAAPGQRVPYGRHATAVVAVEGGALRLYTSSACSWEEGRSPAGEPLDAVTFTGPPVAQAATNADLMVLGAFARVAHAAGALEAAFALTLEHVNTRVQFGKPLAKFQAVQQAMAELSVEAAAVDAAGQALAAAMDLGDGGGDAGFEAACAKLRANIAIERSFPIAHRLHGAIGFTIEYALNHYTRRLMGWRSEYGNDTYWSERLGRAVATIGGEGLWIDMAARGDRVAAT